MAWYTGKSSINVLAFGDSNIVCQGGYQLGVQTYNSANRFWSPDITIPYDPATVSWIPLDNDSTPGRYTGANNGPLIGPDLFIGQVCGGNGASAMQLADTLQQITGIPNYVAMASLGGTIATEWLEDYWDELIGVFTAALAEAPGSPTYADVIYISNGAADLFWGSPRSKELAPTNPRSDFIPPTQEEWYVSWTEIRRRLIAVGFWVPNVTQVIIQEIPYTTEIPAYPAWKGLEFAISRTNDRIALISSEGQDLDPAWTIHFTPQSYTNMGRAAATQVFNQLPTQQSGISVGGQRVSVGGSRLKANAGLPSAVVDPNAFRSVWATTALNETITIPTQNVGTFNATVDWGDGTIETITTYNGFLHVYEYIGEHTISITGVFPNIYFANVAADRLKIKKVTNLGIVGWTKFNSAFWGCTNLTEFTVGSTDTSGVDNMQLMFRECIGLTSLDLSSLNTSLVTNMYAVFNRCYGLTSLNVSFDTSSATFMSFMIELCPALTSIVGVEDWDITGLNNTISLNGFMTAGKMTTAQYDNLLINWEAQASVIPAMTPSFGASTYTGGSAAATARQELGDIDGWSISDGGIEPSAFESVWATTGTFETITIPTQNATFNAVVDWGDSSPPETITTYTGFTHVYDDIGEHTISITGVFPNIYLYLAADSLKLKKVLNLGTVGWNTFNNAFRGCSNLTEFTAGSTDTSAVTNMFAMFMLCSGLTSLNVSSFVTSSVTNMGYMFYGCSALTSLNVSTFGTSSATSMNYMFFGCTGLTSIVGVEDWDITGLDGTADLTNFLTVGKMTTAQYDNLLIKWEAQAEFPGMSPSFGASKYTGGGTAAAARAAMLTVGRYSGISDGGIAP